MSKPSKPSTRKTTPTRGRADLSRLRRMTEAEITRTSPPALRDLPESLWQDVRVVSPVTKQAGSGEWPHVWIRLRHLRESSSRW